MGDESPTLLRPEALEWHCSNTDWQLDTHTKVMPSSPSPFVTLEEIAPSNDIISDGKQTQDSEMFMLRPWIKESRRTSGFLSVGKNVRRYYKQMEETKITFDQIKENDSEASFNSSSEEDKQSEKVSTAVKLSLFLNTTLIIAKAVASYLSGSMSILSSLVDSIVDLVSGVVVWYTSRAVKGTDYYKYPVGKTRLEPISIIVLSVIMAVASIQVIITSITKMIEHTVDPDISTPTIVIIGATVFIKGAMFLYCHQIKKPSTDVLAQDHRNDIVSNSFALGFGYIGYKVWPNADALGAIMISLYIVIGWYRTGKEQIRGLTGHSAQPAMLQKLLWVCLNHDTRIQFIDTLRAYHFGFHFLVEAHIVLPPNMTLEEAHDIGESLQRKLESYSDVERAFVHIDYDYEHHPSVEHKIGHGHSADTTPEQKQVDDTLWIKKSIILSGKPVIKI